MGQMQWGVDAPRHLPCAWPCAAPGPLRGHTEWGIAKGHTTSNDSLMEGMMGAEELAEGQWLDTEAEEEVQQVNEHGRDCHRQMQKVRISGEVCVCVHVHVHVCGMG